MDYVEYKLWKLVALAVIVFVVTVVYGLVTGRSIQQDWRDQKEARRQRERQD